MDEPRARTSVNGCAGYERGGGSRGWEERALNRENEWKSVDERAKGRNVLGQLRSDNTKLFHNYFNGQRRETTT